MPMHACLSFVFKSGQLCFWICSSKLARHLTISSVNSFHTCIADPKSTKSMCDNAKILRYLTSPA